jgi:hypothetical protein
MTRTRPHCPHGYPAQQHHGCNGCSGWHTAGLSACHCTLCHETFTTPSGFDRHRQEPGRSRAGKSRGGKPVPDGVTVPCREPAAVGLARIEPFGNWAHPATDADRERLTAMAERGRAERKGPAGTQGGRASGLTGPVG